MVGQWSYWAEQTIIVCILRGLVENGHMKEPTLETDSFLILPPV